MRTNVCMCRHQGTGGHVWGTCCGNRYMCGFIEGEVKAEGCSCSCLEGPIYAHNQRKEVKSRNCPCATAIWVIQSAIRLSHTLQLAAIWACKRHKSQTSPFSSSSFHPFSLVTAERNTVKTNREIRYLQWNADRLKPEVIHAGSSLWQTRQPQLFQFPQIETKLFPLQVSVAAVPTKVMIMLTGTGDYLMTI